MAEAATASLRLPRRSLSGVLKRPSVPLLILGLAGLLLLALGILISIDVARLKSAVRLTQHTDDVLLEVDGLNNDLAQIAASARAYALTGDRTYVRPLTRFHHDLIGRFQALSGLVSDNPAQVARLNGLRPQIRARADGILNFVARAERGEVAPGARENPAYDAQNELFRRINAFRAVEIGLLGAREARAEHDAIYLAYLSILAALLTPTLAGLSAFLLWRQRQAMERREVQMQLHHAQRLGLMGETASALAHELSQPLSAAGNYLGALRRADLQDAPRQLAQKAQSQVERAGHVLKRLRDFIEKRDRERQPEAPDRLIADAVALLGTMAGQHRLHMAIEPDLPMVEADPIQIQQVLVNLMRNAIEAMAHLPDKDIWLVAKASDGMVEFSLADSGPGLTPNLLERLFLPFTTTKPDGMGLGLSISKRIIQEHGGRIWAENRKEARGAVFHFTLPVVR